MTVNPVESDSSGLRQGTRAIVMVVAILVIACGITGWYGPVLSPREFSLYIFGIFVALVLVALIGRYGLHSIAFVGFVTAAFMLSWTGVRITSYLAVSDVLLFFSSGIVAVLALSNAKEVHLHAGSRPLVVGSILLIIGSLIGGIFSPDPVESVIRLLKVTSATLLIPFAIVLWRPSILEIKWITIAFFTSGVVSSAAAFVLGPDPYSTRSSGLSAHPNALALTAVLSLGPALLFAFRGRGLARLFGSVSTGILLGGILLSGSRAGVIGAVAVLGVVLLLCQSRRIFLSTLAVGSIVIVVLVSGLIQLPGGAVNRLLNPSESAGVGLSNAGREERLQSVFSSIAERPLVGNGLAGARAAHNVYLQVLAASGIIGFVGFIMVIYGTVSPAIRLVRQDGVAATPTTHLLVLGLVSGYAGFLVADLFQNALWERYMWLTPSLVAALTVYLHHVPTSPAKDGKVAASNQPAFGGREKIGVGTVGF